MNESRLENVLMHAGHRFVVLRREQYKGTAREFVRCPLCSREMLSDSVADHVSKHVAREERGSAKAALRELGATPPLPGQLGLSIGGGRSSSRIGSARK